MVLNHLVTLTSDLCVVYVKMLTERFNIDVPHRFVEQKFISPTFCDHCGSVIFGLFRPELQCSGISSRLAFALLSDTGWYFFEYHLTLLY